MFNYKDFLNHIRGNAPKLCYAYASDANSKDNVRLSTTKSCKNCYYSDRESDGSYYCDYHRYHVSPDSYCGYWK